MALIKITTEDGNRGAVSLPCWHGNWDGQIAVNTRCPSFRPASPPSAYAGPFLLMSLTISGTDSDATTMTVCPSARNASSCS